MFLRFLSIWLRSFQRVGIYLVYVAAVLEFFRINLA